MTAQTQHTPTAPAAPAAPAAPPAPATATVQDQFKLFVDIETLGLPRPGLSVPGERVVHHEYPVLSGSFILWSLARGVLWDSGEMLLSDHLENQSELVVDPVAYQMHRSNGLLARVRHGLRARDVHAEMTMRAAQFVASEDWDPSLLEIPERLRSFTCVQDEVLGKLDELVPTGAEVLLAGKSPGSLDAPVIQIHMPGLAGRLSHRTHDISTIERDAELAGTDLGAIVEAAGHVYDHTAASDNRYAVALYEAHLTHVLGLDLDGLRNRAQL